MPGKKCEPGCTCKRHTSWQAGVEASREGVARAKAAGVYKKSAQKGLATKAARTPEEKAEESRRRSESKRQEWAKAKAEGRRRNKHYGSRKRTSKHELALVPYMKALGYQHDTGKRIGHKIPDFVDEERKRVYEYFGTYWHPDRTEEQRIIEYYALRGYSCAVLWENDLFVFLAENQHLVSPPQHELAWRAAHINNGYQKP